MSVGQAAPYKVITVSLATVKDGGVLPGISNADVAFVGILSRPPGSTFYLKFGSGGDAVPLTDNWTGITFDPPHNGGIYYTNPSVQAGDVVLLVTFWQDCA